MEPVKPALELMFFARPTLNLGKDMARLTRCLVPWIHDKDLPSWQDQESLILRVLKSIGPFS